MLLPTALVSRAWGALVRLRRPRFLARGLMAWFVRHAGIDLTDAAPLASYACLEDLFVRVLRPGARPVDPAPEAVVSPVDAVVGAVGRVADGTLLQVKGRTYRLADLLADAQLAARMEGGDYATLYLAPHDYHRIHAPVAGRIVGATMLRGRLLPVFPAAQASVDELFARNERLVTLLETSGGGRVAVVKVGATLVGRISVVYDPELRTNARSRPEVVRRRYEEPRAVERGDELGAFELGSTVVLVAEPGVLRLDRLATGDAVRMGGRIGTRTMELVDAWGGAWVGAPGRGAGAGALLVARGDPGGGPWVQHARRRA